MKHDPNSRQTVAAKAFSGLLRDYDRRKSALAFFNCTPRPVKAQQARVIRPLSLQATGALAIIQSRAVFADGHYWLNEALQGIGYVVREVLKELKRHKLIVCPGHVWQMRAA